LGLGPFVASFLWPYLNTSVFGDDYSGLFLVLSGVALFAALFLFAFFRPPAKSEAGLKEVAAASH